MAAHHSRIAVAIVVALMLALFAACDPTKKVPKPTTGASDAVSTVTPRTDGPASAPR
jgi:hypothetical protein